MLPLNRAASCSARWWPLTCATGRSRRVSPARLLRREEDASAARTSRMARADAVRLELRPTSSGSGVVIWMVAWVALGERTSWSKWGRRAGSVRPRFTCSGMLLLYPRWEHEVSAVGKDWLPGQRDRLRRLVNRRIVGRAERRAEPRSPSGWAGQWKQLHQYGRRLRRRTQRATDRAGGSGERAAADRGHQDGPPRPARPLPLHARQLS